MEILTQIYNHDIQLDGKTLHIVYRYFGVFVENGKWRRLLRHPILAAVMYFERIAVGFTYLANR